MPLLLLPITFYPEMPSIYPLASTEQTTAAMEGFLTCLVFSKQRLSKGKGAFVSSTDEFCYIQLNQSSLQKLGESAEVLMDEWAGRLLICQGWGCINQSQGVVTPSSPLISIFWVHLQGLGMEKEVQWWMSCLHCVSTPPCWWIRWVNPSDTLSSASGRNRDLDLHGCSPA